MNDKFSLAPIDTNLGSLKTIADKAVDGVRAAAEIKDVSKVSFADTLAGAAEDFVQTVNKAEATSIAGLKGDASVYEVATAVMEAERALRMTVAVRDKIVSAYLDISRMQI